MNRAWGRVRASFALILLATMLACERPPQHLVLVTLDTVRADRLSAYGHPGATAPALAALARRGVRFDDAIAQAIVTPPSHASILTGKNPPRHGLRELSGQALAPAESTLAEMLRGEGFSTAAFVSAMPLSDRHGLDQGFDVYDQELPGGMLERRAQRTNARVREWLAKTRSGRVFVWVHYFDPHHPYQPPRAYGPKLAGAPKAMRETPAPRNANPRTSLDPGMEVPSDAEVERMRQLYDAELRYTDDSLAQLFEMLESAGILEDAVVAVVADHGESLGEHGYYFGHWDVFWENARVPMVLAHPDGRFAGTVVEQLVRTIDLLPTVLEWLGLEPPPGLDGVDLTPLIRGDASGIDSAYTEQLQFFPVYAVRTRDWLLVRDEVSRREGDRPALRLYRRVGGRAVPEDVAARHPEVLAELQQRLDSLQVVADPGAAVEVPVSDEIQQQLRALGYIEEH